MRRPLVPQYSGRGRLARRLVALWHRGGGGDTQDPPSPTEPRWPSPGDMAVMPPRAVTHRASSVSPRPRSSFRRSPLLCSRSAGAAGGSPGHTRGAQPCSPPSSPQNHPADPTDSSSPHLSWRQSHPRTAGCSSGPGFPLPAGSRPPPPRPRPAGAGRTRAPTAALAASSAAPKPAQAAGAAAAQRGRESRGVPGVTRAGGAHLALPPVLLEQFVVAGVAGLEQPEEPAGGQHAVGHGGLRGAGGAQLGPRLPLLDLLLHHAGDDAVQDAGQAVVLGWGSTIGEPLRPR